MSPDASRSAVAGLYVMTIRADEVHIGFGHDSITLPAFEGDAGLVVVDAVVPQLPGAFRATISVPIVEKRLRALKATTVMMQERLFFDVAAATRDADFPSGESR